MTEPVATIDHAISVLLSAHSGRDLPADEIVTFRKTLMRWIAGTRGSDALKIGVSALKWAESNGLGSPEGEHREPEIVNRAHLL